jgi:hypothetical protein
MISSISPHSGTACTVAKCTRTISLSPLAETFLTSSQSWMSDAPLHRGTCTGGHAQGDMHMTSKRRGRDK